MVAVDEKFTKSRPLASAVVAPPARASAPRGPRTTGSGCRCAGSRPRPTEVQADHRERHGAADRSRRGRRSSVALGASPVAGGRGRRCRRSPASASSEPRRSRVARADEVPWNAVSQVSFGIVRAISWSIRRPRDVLSRARSATWLAQRVDLGLGRCARREARLSRCCSCAFCACSVRAGPSRCRARSCGSTRSRRARRAAPRPTTAPIAIELLARRGRAPSPPTRLMRRPVASPPSASPAGVGEVRVEVSTRSSGNPMSPIASCSRGRRGLDRAGRRGRELLGETGGERRAAGERDPQQPRRAGLRAVVVERAADLLDEIRERARHRGRARSATSPGHLVGLALERLGLVERDLEVARDRLGERAAAEPEDADEARQAGLVDDHHGDAAADADDRLGARRRCPRPGARSRGSARAGRGRRRRP